MSEYATAKGISWRDDSILTWPGLHNWPERFNVARPNLFEDVWRKFPAVLETSHYNEILRDGAYNQTPTGSIRAYDDLRGSIRLTHATYLGYDGDARKWLSDHPALAKELANTLGYWYFPASMTFPPQFVVGDQNPLRIVWENKGTAPAYRRFTLRVKLTANGHTLNASLKEADNRNWMPGSESTRITGSKFHAALGPGATGLHCSSGQKFLA